MKKVFFSLLFLCCLFTPVEAKKYKKSKPYSPVSASIIMEAETGKILQAENPHKITHPASLTKIMSLYLVFEALEQKKIKYSQRMPVSKLATQQEPSKLWLREGQTITVMDAILAMVTNSSNDASVAVAEFVAGSVPNFVARMNQKARELGMHNTKFSNCNGLPPRGQSNMTQITTAHDMAVLSRAIYKRFPSYYRYFRTKSFIFKGQVYHNHNHLIGKVPGVDGIKTGFINASGFNIAVSVKRNGVRLIVVVMGGPTWRARDSKAIALVDRAFSGNLTAYANTSSSEPEPLSVLENKDLSKGSYVAALTPADMTLSSYFKKYKSSPQVQTLAQKSPPENPGVPDQVLELVDARDQILADDEMSYSLTDTFEKLIITGDGGTNDAKTFNRPQAGLETVALEEPMTAEATPADVSQEPRDWIVQLGAYGRAQGAQDRLHMVKQKLDDLPGKISIEKRKRKKSAVYQAQVSGLSQKEAQKICRDLKEGGDVCLALKMGKPVISPVLQKPLPRKKPAPSILSVKSALNKKGKVLKTSGAKQKKVRGKKRKSR